MWQEFKKFAFKGNVMDLAVGVVIGGAFGKIVTSLVNDIIMPVFGYITAGMDFKDLKWVLSPATIANGEVIKPESAIMYGNFIQNIVDFLIIAVSIFFFIRIANRLHAGQQTQSASEAPKGPTAEELLTEIRDLLKKQV